MTLRKSRIQDLLTGVEEKQLQWFGHAKGMERVRYQEGR
jgi:hypothetical protein